MSKRIIPAAGGRFVVILAAYLVALSSGAFAQAPATQTVPAPAATPAPAQPPAT